MAELRPRWVVRSAKGAELVAEYDSLRRRWRVEPGGYERRDLADALAQASGERRDAGWIIAFVDRVSGEIA